MARTWRGNSGATGSLLGSILLLWVGYQVEKVLVRLPFGVGAWFDQSRS